MSVATRGSGYTMKERFEGNEGARKLFEVLMRQKIVGNDANVAKGIAECARLVEYQKDDVLIEQNGEDSDVSLILSGSVRIVVNGHTISIRYPDNHVGEMAAVEPTQRRAASVVANEPTLVAKISESHLSSLAEQYPKIWRILAQELARRLHERNNLLYAPHDKIRLFIISSKEALSIARAIESEFEHDDFDVRIWTSNVFKVANYTLEDLEHELELSDFAVAIAHPDDTTTTRGEEWPTPRDNVVFELGYFMGWLGRKRAILMEPRDESVKLPSDLTGITTITYRYNKGDNPQLQMGPACNKLRLHMQQLGAYL